MPGPRRLVSYGMVTEREEVRVRFLKQNKYLVCWVLSMGLVAPDTHHSENTSVHDWEFIFYGTITIS